MDGVWDVLGGEEACDACDGRDGDGERRVCIPFVEGVVICDDGLATDVESVMGDGCVCACGCEGGWDGHNCPDAVEVERLVQEAVEIGETTVIGEFDGRDEEGEGRASVVDAIWVALETEEAEERRREEETVDE